jgi:hypothetical protein
MKKKAEEARRRDSDDEDGGPVVAKRGATPDGSRWGGGSNAGESRMGDSKSGAAPVKGQATANSTASASKFGGISSLMPEHLGNDLWNEKLAEVRDIRNKLDEKIKSTKKKRKKKGGKKSNLKGAQSEDDNTSAYTGVTSEQDAL